MKRLLPALVPALLACACAQAPRPAPEAGRLLRDGTGTELRVPERAERIVSLAPDLTQTLFAIGAGEAVVGVSQACDRPAGALEALTRVGTMVEPSLERILVLEPDLVLASADGNPLESLERLRSLGVTVYGVKPTAPGLGGVRDRVSAIAAASGREDGARSLLADFDRGLDRARAAAAGRESRSACWLVWEDPPIAAGEGTFVDGMMELAGLENACARGDEAWPRLSREQLLVASPEALLISSGVHGDPRETLGAWAAPIPALKDERVLRLDGDRFLRPTLELAVAAGELVAATRAWWPAP